VPGVSVLFVVLYEDLCINISHISVGIHHVIHFFSTLNNLHHSICHLINQLLLARSMIITIFHSPHSPSVIAEPPVLLTGCLPGSCYQTSSVKLLKCGTGTSYTANKYQLECGPKPHVMVALPNTGGALCSMLQSLADAHY